MSPRRVFRSSIGTRLSATSRSRQADCEVRRFPVGGTNRRRGDEPRTPRWRENSGRTSWSASRNGRNPRASSRACTCCSLLPIKYSSRPTLERSRSPSPSAPLTNGQERARTLFFTLHTSARARARCSFSSPFYTRPVPTCALDHRSAAVSPEIDDVVISEPENARFSQRSPYRDIAIIRTRPFRGTETTQLTSLFPFSFSFSSFSPLVTS